MTCPVDQALCIRRGDGHSWNLTFIFNDAPIDISNSDIWITFKEELTDADPGALQVTKTFPADAESVAGRGTLSLLGSETDDLDPEVSYYYDIQWLPVGGEPKTMAAGKVKVLPDVTRSVA